MVSVFSIILLVQGGVTMNYIFKRMTQREAEDIAFNWHYDGIYSFYDMEADQEDLEEFLDESRRGDTVFSVHHGNELVGFFSINPTYLQTVDIGLGMRPDLTGAGRGMEFFNAGLEFVKETYAPQRITLAVATFNLRAIKVYEKAGFEPVEVFTQATNGGTYEFLKMKYKCN